MRILLTYILPLMLPTLLYFLWLYASGKKAAKAGGGEVETVNLRDVPWTWLAFAGLALAIVVTLGLSMGGGGGTEANYVPPRIGEDGQIVPGHFEDQQ